VPVPFSLFLKFCKSNDLYINDSEYLYYKHDYHGLPDSPLPVCYDAQYSASDGSYHVLLEDLSQSHYSNKDIRPTPEHALTVASELARLHAFKWETKANESGIQADTVSQIYAFIEHVSKGLKPLSKNLDDEVPPHWLAGVPCGR
jgi:hypothetical protein